MPTNSATTPSNGQVQRTRPRQTRRRLQPPPAPAAASNPPPATRHPQPAAKGQGPRVGDLFPTRWIHPDDLQGKTVNVFIEKVTIEKLWSAFDKEHVEKIVLWFHGKTKQLPLNVTQAQALVNVTGTDFVMDWTGHGCRLRAATARNGKPTIEILPPLPANQTTHAAAAAAVAADAADASVASAPSAPSGEFGSTDRSTERSRRSLPDDEPVAVAEPGSRALSGDVEVELVEPPSADEEIPDPALHAAEYIDEDDANALFGS